MLKAILQETRQWKRFGATADLQALQVFNLLLHVKWPDFEPFSCFNFLHLDNFFCLLPSRTVSCSDSAR